MAYFGRVKNGKIELESSARLPEGVIVRIEPVSPASNGSSGDNPIYRLADMAVDGGPPDLAEEHDHYAHGAPKKAQGG